MKGSLIHIFLRNMSDMMRYTRTEAVCTVEEIIIPPPCISLSGSQPPSQSFRITGQLITPNMSIYSGLAHQWLHTSHCNTYYYNKHAPLLHYYKLQHSTKSCTEAIYWSHSNRYRIINTLPKQRSNMGLSQDLQSIYDTCNPCNEETGRWN